MSDHRQGIFGDIEGREWLFQKIKKHDRKRTKIHKNIQNTGTLFITFGKGTLMDYHTYKCQQHALVA